MMRGILACSTLVSVIAFPWPLTVLLALAASLTEPLIPLAAGLLADTLYYAPHAQTFPFFTLGGAAVTAAVVFVRGRLSTRLRVF